MELMALQQVLNQFASAIKKSEFKSARRLLQLLENKYGNNPYFFWQKAIYEQSIGSDKKSVVLPLLEKAYNGGLKDLNFLRHCGEFFLEFGVYRSACRIYGEIVHIKQDDIEAFITLADIFLKLGNPISAINALKLAAKINPSHSSMPIIYCTMAKALMISGYPEESIKTYNKALELDNKNIGFINNYLFYLNYVDMSRKDFFLLCRKHSKLWENEILIDRPPFPQTEKIKIGFVSRDFHFHTVSFFIRALFENYDKNRFEIHLFSILKKEKYDNVTEMFIAQADKWYDISETDAQDTVDLIKKEEISVLVDLAGYTDGTLLKIFGSRPAPVQVSYCGYPNTTGLKSIDYRITDRICEPDDAQNYHTEKLFKIDKCFLCYQPYFEMIPKCTFENPQNRPIIFGSFNNLSKITDNAIKIWSDAIKAVPDSKIVLKHMYLNDLKLREITISRFVKNGLSGDRILIYDYNLEMKEHYAQYNKIDIALDTFPYNGTTTTCDALYMGVPVITILGDRHASRVSASLLNAIGLGELVAKDEKEFTKIAVDLAGNIQKLVEIKRNLRERIQNSPLMDKKSFTQKWQNAILDMINETKRGE